MANTPTALIELLPRPGSGYNGYFQRLFPMTSRLALFDLDNTLLHGDSDHAWGEFLIEKGLVDADTHRKANDAFYADYLEASLDIHAYVNFTLQPILQLNGEERSVLHAEFMQKIIEPMILASGENLLSKHHRESDDCVLITATNSFITQPIANRLGVDVLLATDLEMAEDKFTGKIQGIPCYQQGKVEKLNEWMERARSDYDLSEACFYTDSINDLGLLEKVGEPIAVDPDQQLEEVARANNWQIISLRQ